MNEIDILKYIVKPKNLLDEIRGWESKTTINPQGNYEGWPEEDIDWEDFDIIVKIYSDMVAEAVAKENESEDMNI